MIIEKDTYNNNLYFVDDNVTIFRTAHIGAEFVVIKSNDRPIIITEKDDKYLYNNLLWIFDNKYVFDNNKLSSMTDDKIIWFSDQACDIENKEETDKVDRIVIERTCDSIIITCHNPFCERYNIKKSQNVVAFSPAGNGFYSKNLTNGNTFQNDFINSIYKAIMNEYIGSKKVTEKVHIKNRR